MVLVSLCEPMLASQLFSFIINSLLGLLNLYS